MFARRASPTIESVLSKSQTQLDSPTQESGPADAVETTKAAGETMAAVLEDLNQLAQDDPAGHRELTDELKSTRPELWPLIVQQFHATRAYRETLSAGPSSQQLATETISAQPEFEETDPAKEPPINVPGSSESVTDSVAGTDFSPLGELVDPRRVRSEMVASEVFAGQTPANLTPPGIDAARARAPRHNASELGSAEHNRAVRAIFPAAKDPGDMNEVVPAVFDRPLNNTSNDWRDSLNDTLATLVEENSEFPQTTSELLDHVRLRLLQLAAGHTDEAVKPIPGISPNEQDYWSKQMFALATYMNANQQPSDKRRAAASAIQLEDALGKLRSIGTMSVRNLAFCEEVVDFGVYTTHASNQFLPGEQVTLYAEIENFQTTDADASFRTSVASSYEVLDQHGQRVDGGQFPDVEDECRRRRRDFHIQYGFALPTRIYPGRYRLQLVVKDNQSDKIGQNTIDFEIKDDRRQ